MPDHHAPLGPSTPWLACRRRGVAVLIGGAVLLALSPSGSQGAEAWSAQRAVVEPAQRRAADQAPAEAWRLMRAIPVQNASSTVYHPVDGLLYVGERVGPVGRQDLRLLRIHADNSLSMIANGSNMDALVVDPDDGDIFASDSTSGTIFRTGYLATGRTAWVSGFAPGDDDPTGMAIAPHDYAGPVLEPGQAIVVDHGFAGSPPGIWRWSPDSPEGEVALHEDDGSLVRPVDVAIGDDAIYILDNRSHTGRDPSVIYRMNGLNDYVAISTSEPIMHATGMVVDPATGDLWLAEATNGRVIRVGPETGQVTTVLTGFEFFFSNWANIDFTPDGSQLIVTDRGLGRVSVFARDPADAAEPVPTNDCPPIDDAVPLEDGEERTATLATDGAQHDYVFDVDMPFTRVEVSLPDAHADLRLFVRRRCAGQPSAGPGRSIGSGSGRQIGDAVSAAIDVGLRTGRYVASVHARPGAARVERPYRIRLRLSPINPEATRTLILSGAERMADVWRLDSESPEWVRWQEDLDALATRSDVGGLVVGDVQYETNADVEAAYKRWLDDPADAWLANALVRSIRAWIDDVVAVLPGIRYIVLVGDDRIIPHYRLPIVDDDDLASGWLRESEYPDLGTIDPESTIGTALRRDYTLSDDAYAARRPIVWRDAQRLWVPELAVGRLVERPSDVSAAIRAYIAHDGALLARRSLVAGYDFMQDGVEAADDALAAAGLPAERRTRIVGDDLRASALITELLATRRDLAFIGAHASHGRLDLPGSTSVGAEEVTRALAEIDGTVAFALACHAGLNVPGSAHAQPLDFAEAWQRRGASWIGATGWAYGMDGFLGYQEALLADFAQHLAAPTGAKLGDALVEAKRDYFLGHELSPMHVKTIAATVLYGLPMLKVDLDVPRTTSVASASTAPQSPSAHAIRPRPDALRAAPRHAQQSSSRLIVEGRSLSFGPSSLTRRELPGVPGSYFAFGGVRPRAGAGEPVQPRELRALESIDRDGVMFQPSGVVLVGGRFRDVPDFTPLVLPAGVIGHRAHGVLGVEQSMPFALSGWYPRIPIQVRRIAGWQDRPTRVTLQTTVGQFHAATRTERLLESIDLEMYHTTMTDALGPVVADIAVTTSDGTTSGELRATDASGIVRVVVAHAAGDTYWRSVELIESNGGTWSGTWPTAQTYFVQVVDGAGNVTTVDETGRVHRPCVEPCDEAAWHGVPGTVTWLPSVLR